MRIARAETDADVARCHAVMAQLRPHVTADRFVETVARMSREGGYALAFVEDGGEVVAVAGFRVFEMLARGRHMYVDDLVTSEAVRSRGHGAALLAWLVEEARRLGCGRVDLDSGMERERAHAFYRRNGMRATSLHFAIDVPGGPAE